MTLKTSWFNFGIYKNAIRRFKWGSFLYFIILFLAVPFMFFVGNYSYGYYWNYHEADAVPQMILERDFLIVPMITAYAVAVVVAVILHRYMHESKQCIALHSMPVTRRSNYISNLFAGFTLMFAPVVANGLILLVMSFTDYGKFFSPVSVLYWMLLNIAVLFIMFSVSTFAAFLTGQWAAHIAINGLLHSIPVFAALGIVFFSNVFLYGFAESSSSVATVLIDNTPYMWIFNHGINQPFENGFFGTLNMVVYFGMAIVLYILGGVIYNARKVENCGNVAAFKTVRHILKYGITALIMLVVSAISYGANFDLLKIVVYNLVFGAIGYFATEMVLSKSFKVFGKYKGFLAFCVAATAFVCFFAFTSVFGYETRVPDVADVKEASIYYYSETIPYVEDEEFIRNITQMHKKHIEKTPVINPTHYNQDYNIRPLNISYKLKNGKELIRRYWMDEEEYEAILNAMYENETYKFKAENLFYLNIKALGGMEMEARINGQGSIYTYYFNRDEAQRLIKAYMNDLSKMSFEEIKSITRDVYYKFEISTHDDNGELLEKVVTPDGAKAYTYMPYSFNYPFNSNFAETMAILKETGHYESIMQTIAENLYIGVVPIEIKAPEGEEVLSQKEVIHEYKEDVGYVYEFKVSLSDCAKLEYEDARTYAETLPDKKTTETLASGKYYALYWIPGYDSSTRIEMTNRFNVIGENDLPDYLKKYVE